MKKAHILTLFCCLAVIQIFMPFSTILVREYTLSKGIVFRFLTAPIDPYDAFRGRYVALGLEQNKAPKPEGIKLFLGQQVYALIEEDSRGYAKIASISLTKPEGNSYIKVRIDHLSGKEVFLRLPFDRYYMEEKTAPAAEKAYRKHSTGESRDAYIAVRVKSGNASIEELYVGGQPISEFVRDNK